MAEIFTNMDGSALYEDTFFDQTMDGPINVWNQMFEHAKEQGLLVDVESIRFTKVYSPMIGEEETVVGFKMSGELRRG